jgi:hypothetical protein
MAVRSIKTAIAPDSTISDVVATLANPVEYVRRVLEKLEHCRRLHGDAQVRVGIKSRAECPNYLIESVKEDKKTKERVVTALAAYSGSTHRELAPRHIDDAASWSPEEMSVSGVSALIGRLRNPRAPQRDTDEE